MQESVMQAVAAPQSVTSLTEVLLFCAVGLLVVLMVVAVGLLVSVSRRLARIEWRLAGGGAREEAGAVSPSQAETSAGGAFETFLNEEPARRALPKGEQFAAYRRWRQENGLNWSNS